MLANRFLVKLDKELLSLRCIAMDDVCKRLFARKESIELRYKEKTQKLMIDWHDNLLSGRGIVGFFKDIPNGNLFIEPVAEDVFMIVPPGTDFGTLPEGSREHEVLTNMSVFETVGSGWMNTYYEVAAIKGVAHREDLICLNHLGRIDKYQYQIDTVSRVFNDFKGRVILADEVGLGKTIEAGMAMTEYIMRGLVKNVLILTPASLVDQWYTQMRTLFNQDFIRSDDPTFKKGGNDAWHKHKKIIASLSAAKRKQVSKYILSNTYDMVIVDEAHHLKNRKTVAWQFVNGINKKYMLLLSATPVQNSLEELYNLITLIRPGQLKTYSYFKKNFMADRSGLELKNKDKLKELMASAMIRNRRSQVDIKFTKRFAITKSLASSKKEKKLYDNISEFIRKEYAAGKMTKMVLKNIQERIGSTTYAAIKSIEKLIDSNKFTDTQLSQLQSFYEISHDLAQQPSTKMLELIKIINGFDGQLLVFTKYVPTLEALTNFLRQNNIEIATFHGSMRRAAKEAQIKRFKDGAKVLLSTEAGGEGRNLQFCNGLVNFDLPWNPMAIEQRIGRLHRIGQTQDVYVFNLCNQDTVEHHILEILDKKINLFELAVGEVDMILGDLEEEQDFSEIIMDVWTKSNDSSVIEQDMDALGEQLLLNKQHLERIKGLDNTLFE